MKYGKLAELLANPNKIDISDGMVEFESYLNSEFEAVTYFGSIIKEDDFKAELVQIESALASRDFFDAYAKIFMRIIAVVNRKKHIFINDVQKLQGINPARLIQRPTQSRLSPELASEYAKLIRSLTNVSPEDKAFIEKIFSKDKLDQIKIVSNYGNSADWNLREFFRHDMWNGLTAWIFPVSLYMFILKVIDLVNWVKDENERREVLKTLQLAQVQMYGSLVLHMYNKLFPDNPANIHSLNSINILEAANHIFSYTQILKSKFKSSREYLEIKSKEEIVRILTPEVTKLKDQFNVLNVDTKTLKDITKYSKKGIKDDDTQRVFEAIKVLSASASNFMDITHIVVSELEKI